MNICKIKLFVLLSISLCTFNVKSESVYLNDPQWISPANYKNIQEIKSDNLLENRVMFDEDIAWALSKANTDKIISHLSQSGFNVYVPCVWHGDGAYFKSNIAYVNKQIEGRIKNGDDPLKYLIKAAHAKNIEVHPWVTVVRRESNRYSEFYDEYSPENAFDVHNEKFRGFIKSFLLDLVSGYSIDGLNLDYIRSMGYCNSNKCKEEYSAKTSRSLTEDLLLEKIPKSRIKSIELWNEEPVEEIVKTVSAQAKLIKPKLMISVDSMPNARHLRMQGHDSQKWLNNNWIDSIFYMEYENDFKVSDIDLSKEKVVRKNSIILLLSLYDMEHTKIERKPGLLLKKYVEAIRNIWPGSGVAFYHYKQLTDDQRAVLGSTVFAKAACTTWRNCELEK